MEPETSSGVPIGTGRQRPGSQRVAWMVIGTALCLLSVVCLVGGGWALWKDRIDRDGSGFVSIGTTRLRTETYAIVGNLRGGGPSWVYGSKVLGQARVRATSSSSQPLFIGIARKADVNRYLRGVGYATIYNFEVTSHTTHPGGPPSGSPSDERIWAASTQGVGEQTLFWTPRDGEWSVVFMNSDAGAGVAVHGGASAKIPVLPWVAAGLLAAAAASGLVGGWVLVRTVRRGDGPAPSPPDEPDVATTAPTPVGVAS